MNTFHFAIFGNVEVPRASETENPSDPEGEKYDEKIVATTNLKVGNMLEKTLCGTGEPLDNARLRAPSKFEPHQADAPKGARASFQNRVICGKADL